MPRESFDHKEIERSAQEKWEKLDLYATDLTDDSKEKYYLLFEFPYPSGDLHIGHWYAFALTDIYARKLRMAGKNVLFPMGFDAFGLPAENAAIKNGVDPKKWTYENMERMRTQMRTMGASMDWSKEVVTCDPGYYKWTQWLFAKLFEHGLAERKNAAVKWCPFDKTVLANEQVIDGHCERCGHEVEEKNLTQWFLKITQYAERLLKDLEPLPWREDIKDAQRAWIGESEGAKLVFMAHTGEEDAPVPLEVFTTRPDTVFGATYLVLAPEHPMVDVLIQDALNPEAIRAYQRETGKKTERERSENKEKTGVALEGITATNPATKEEVPVYLADYVLASYGTGAVMAVPAHDERDFEFAQRYQLPIKDVIEPVFVRTIGTDAVRPEEPMVERQAVVAIVKHWGEDKYLCLRWKSNDWTGFVIGGIEEGEEPSVTGAREITEETGYKNPRFVRDMGVPTHSQFYHEVKRQNRFAHFTPLYYELADGEREEPSAEELAIHDIEWVAKEDMDAYLSRDNDIAYIWKRFVAPAFPYTGDGILANSDSFDGRSNREAMTELIAYAGGEAVKQYRLRDWLVSRQRYWGCPIPIVYDPEGNAHLVPNDHLPWLLPEDVDFTPGAAGVGTSPLSTSRELKERVERIFGAGWTPEYDTLDTFVDSSWYYLRYVDPADAHDFSDQGLLKKWMPVDRYSGGSEHTTMHLLYARFFNKALYDLALVPTSEPFNERYNRGVILGPDGAKMSKSKGNVINPDEVVSKFGSDAVRMYLAFIGPYNETGSYPWNLDGAFAMRKFLDRVYTLFEGTATEKSNPEVLRALAVAIDKVTADTDRFKFNTALSALMVLVRDLESHAQLAPDAKRTLLALLAPFAPHLAEHLWEKMGEEGSVHQMVWPEADPALLSASEIVIGVQVNGKKRGEVRLSLTASEDEALMEARKVPAIALLLGETAPARVVYVPGRILNIVTQG
ncbi:MAG: leucyl-tRNA synthetase [Parcubacteria group bacterium]|nr:leucyl-tRNA synthetase [Parcubacteria group bacterium]